MLDRLTAQLQFHAQALALRAERQKLLAANIANADTPGYQARDVDFAAALLRATGDAPANAGAAPATAARAGLAVPAQVTTDGPAATDPRHLSLDGAPAGASARVVSTARAELRYRVPEQASMDGNTVDLNRERANFADNAVRYEATLKFINQNVRSVLSAIRGD